MCGINGFNFNDQELIEKMNRATKHRGPDADGFYVDENISLGHNRLSIIDLSAAANQPMISNDGNYIIVYNGELYNFKEIKKDLEGEYKFKTRGDTEVVLASYIKWGSECVKKFNGIFAFAIWDKQKKELFIARDSSGVKPFYYYWDNKKFIFSSEIKGILEHNIDRLLDSSSFFAYTRILYVPGPKTMFKNIYKLHIGHYGILRGQKLVVTDYKQEPDKEVFNLSYGSLKEKVKLETFNAVKRQMVSDKPVGIFLSGGIDSSVVLSCASKLNNRIKTFSSGFDLGKKELSEKYNHDMLIARKTAKYFGSDHNEVILKTSEAFELMEKAIYTADEPAANATFLATYNLSAFAKKHVDVVLTGDGGDEIFGGYRRYQLALACEYYKKLPTVLKKYLNRYGKISELNVEPGAEMAIKFFYQKNSPHDLILKEESGSLQYIKKYFNDNLSDRKYFRTFTEQYMNLDSKTWLVYESHLRGDKMTMAHGLEARLPFTDKVLIEMASKIKLKYKVGLFDSKIILKEAFKKELPDFLLKEKKRGWLSPGKKWFRSDEFRESVKEIFSNDYYGPSKDIVNWNAVQDICSCDVKSRKAYSLLWSLLVFQVWAKKYKVEMEF
jgi:asparagine synthase (glutamine-hydrolysing)